MVERIRWLARVVMASLQPVPATSQVKLLVVEFHAARVEKSVEPLEYPLVFEQLSCHLLCEL